MPQLQPFQDRGSATGSGGHQKVVFSQAAGHTVVGDHAIVFTHQAVTAFTNRQFLPLVGVDPRQEFTRIRPLDIDLAKR